MTEQIQIDLRAKKTESQWLETSERFWLAAAPKLFEWLGWVALIAALTFVHQKQPSLALGIVIGICYASLLFYFFAFFARVKIIGIYGLRSARAQRVVAIILSSILASVAYYLVRYVASALTAVGG